MDAFLRIVAIIIELLVLGAVFYHIFGGIYFMLFDIGVKQKYSKIVVLSLLVGGTLLAVFLVSHLITFYPAV